MKRISFLPVGSLLLGLLLTTAACKKDVDTLTPGNGGVTSPAFVGPRWQMTAFLLDPSADFDGDGKVDQDLLPFMPACDRDDNIVFDPNGKVMTSEGQLRCDNDPSDNVKPDAWTYNTATRTITITDGDDPGSVSTWEVLEASSKTLNIKTTVVEDGKTFTAILKWKAI